MRALKLLFRARFAGLAGPENETLKSCILPLGFRV